MCLVLRSIHISVADISESERQIKKTVGESSLLSTINCRFLTATAETVLPYNSKARIVTKSSNRKFKWGEKHIQKVMKNI